MDNDKQNKNLNQDDLTDEERIDLIDQMEDPEEIKATIEIYGERIDGTDDSDTSSTDDETSKKEDTSSKEKSDKEDKKVDNDKAKTDDKDGEADNLDKKDFTLTEDEINKKPEDDRAILNKYKDKTKEDIAKATANAIVMKSAHLKGNQKYIDMLTQDLMDKPNDELLNTLIETQRESGRVEEEEGKPTQIKLELPSLPKDDANIQSALDNKTLDLLKEKYKDSSSPIPEEVTSFNDEKYKEWRRDLNVDEPDNTYQR